MLTIDEKANLIHEFPVEFTDGSMTIDKAKFKEQTKALNGAYILTIRKPSKKRSHRQNRVQWWYFTEIAKETGHTPNMIKGMMQLRFLMRHEWDEKLQSQQPYILGTSELSTLEHNDFCEDIREWAQKFLSMNLPLPNDHIFDEM